MELTYNEINDIISANKIHHKWVDEMLVVYPDVFSKMKYDDVNCPALYQLGTAIVEIDEESDEIDGAYSTFEFFDCIESKEQLVKILLTIKRKKKGDGQHRAYPSEYWSEMFNI